ncbi:hypothetical protein H072_7625 [Dactylellina haptotyla CBS 200.50]|uniref:Major facilitator superfamily (MFS) profile domain-containing protein n=1 Tax=Dactylellina haptotyla (strain CBS 200.50) TaxID=1284197 RepID=S8ABV6_DACHA|nr:hypothetical protein H072_7625 [Dactylellina haptotyla CBS 200.50]
MRITETAHAGSDSHQMGDGYEPTNENDVRGLPEKEVEEGMQLRNASKQGMQNTKGEFQRAEAQKDIESQTRLGDKIPYWKFILDQGVLTDRIISHKCPGSGTEEDPYRVEYIPDDPRNPLLFSPLVKWAITMVVAFATLAIAFVSSAYSGGMQQIMAEFHCSTIVAILGISLFVLGFTIGPLFWAPLSEMYGRQRLFFGTYAALTAFNAGAAGAKNIQTLLIMRFFAGAFGSSPLTNAGGVIADMFPASQRGLAMAVFAACPFMGPVMGPIAGGFLGQSAGWRWVEGLLAAFSGLTWLMMAFGVPETYSPVLLSKRAQSLSKLTGKVYVSKFEAESGKVGIKEAYKTALSRPWILLFREPIVAMLSIYMAIIYGTLYMLFAAYPIVYQKTRGWSQGVGGLPFLGVAVGMLAAVIYSIPENKRYNRIADKKFNGFAPPEQRLPPALVGSVCIPIGLFWFAWSNGPNVHWFASVAAGTPFGFGMVMVFLSVFNYLIDSYTIFAASVLAANAVLRSTFGAVFPLFTGPMYQKLGIHWASSVPAFLALACVPAPFLFYKYGEAVRLKCKYAGRAAEFMQQLQKQSEENNEFPIEEPAAEKDDEISMARILQDNSGRLEIPLPRLQLTKTQSRSSVTKDGLSRQHTKESRTCEKEHQANGLRRWESNPFDIDRVNSHEAFES